MCNPACIDFGKTHLSEEDVRGRAVIEVGAMDVNGSLRHAAEQYSPQKYIGVDLQMGPGVDEVCNADDLLERFGEESFDVLICTEVLEHVADWRRVINNFKRILRPGGMLLITTRSKGFYYHDFPFDCWRYELQDMKQIFSDFDIEVLEKDPFEPGIFIKARRPGDFDEKDLSSHRLYSIMRGSHALEKKDSDICIFKVRRFFWLILPRAVKNLFKKHKLTFPLLRFEDFYN